MRAVVELDKTRFKFNPNALHCFQPLRVYPHTPPCDLPKVAFFTLENNVTVKKDEDGAIAPL